MKHSHIGLVVLAATAIAGCGGGSDNGGGGSSFDVENLTRDLRNALVGFEGETYEIPAGKSREVDVGNGQTVIFSGCPDGCSVTVSRSNGQTVVTASVDDVTARLQSPQTRNDSGSTSNTGGNDNEIEELNEEIAEKDAEIADLKNQVSDADERTEAKQRAPKWADALYTTDANYGSDDQFTAVEVSDMRDGKRTVGPVDPYPNSKSAPSIYGFTGTASARGLGSTNEDTVYLYTNIERPNTREFWKVYGSQAVEGVSGVDFLDDSDSADMKFRKIANVPRSTPKGTQSPDYSGAEGGYDRVEIAGRLSGASGTFICTDCSGSDASDTSADAAFSDGEWSIKRGSWTFKSSSPTAPVRRDQDDAYLYFGIWASEPKALDGTPDIGWIAGGGARGLGNANNITASNFTTLKGTATFAGGAIGQYAIDRTDRSGPAKVGIFTATISLTADFGTPQTAGTLFGTISSFQEKDGSNLDSWNLHLGDRANAAAPMGSAMLAATGVAASTDRLSVFGSIDGINVVGDWHARLYGEDNADAAPEGDRCRTTNGCGVDVAGFTGWFRATDFTTTGTGDSTSIEAGGGDVVAIGGAFGAAKQ